MTIEQYQKNILSLLKTNQPIDKDEYFINLQKSPSLALIKKIALWWRMLDIEQFCSFTSKFLKKINLFENKVLAFYEANNVSTNIDNAGLAFLTFIALEEKGVIKSIAEFESALLKTKRGCKDTYTVEWSYDPYAVFSHILNNTPYEQQEGNYTTIISADMPNSFQVINQEI